MAGRELLMLVTGAAKAIALHRAVECATSHMWTASAFQSHERATFVVDEEATAELRVKTVRYFKGLMTIHNQLLLLDEEKRGHRDEKKGAASASASAPIHGAQGVLAGGAHGQSSTVAVAVAVGGGHSTNSNSACESEGSEGSEHSNDPSRKKKALDEIDDKGAKWFHIQF